MGFSAIGLKGEIRNESVYFCKLRCCIKAIKNMSGVGMKKVAVISFVFIFINAKQLYLPQFLGIPVHFFFIVTPAVLATSAGLFDLFFLKIESNLTNDTPTT